MTKRQSATKSAPMTVQEIDDLWGNVIDQMLYVLIADELKAGARKGKKR